MPLVHSEKIEENSTLLLWSLTESETELRESLGFTYNFGELESISHPQKIREWLASRLLIKTLAVVTKVGAVYLRYKYDSDIKTSKDKTNQYQFLIIFPINSFTLTWFFSTKISS